MFDFKTLLEWTLNCIFSAVSCGETSLDRICCAVGGKVIMQPLLQTINNLQKNDDWRCLFFS